MPAARGTRRRRTTRKAEEDDEDNDATRVTASSMDIVGNDDDNNNNKEPNHDHDDNDNNNASDHDDDDDRHNSQQQYGRSQQLSVAGTTATSIEDADEDTLRIMLSTDNHLGYQEENSIRGNDSFAALEEVLYLARHYKCDLVLLAGDLFHDNRPSRRTLFKTMEIFRRYCMGPNPVQVQILPNQDDDQTKNTLAHGKVNYEDESYSIDLPVFSIHGNHDDPSRDAGGTELFAALDLLNVANLVNYFGKQTNTKDIRVDPICLKKGITRVAMYGLGSMRDERLNRMWRDDAIHFSKPQQPNQSDDDDDEDDENSPKYFNVFALHQNRDFGRGAKNSIKEDMIPEWMDLICWGHEHECCIELQESVVGTFRISQPGSSVATSLVAGEAERKKVGILDIRGTDFRLLPIPLTQVRSFVMKNLSLAEQKTLDPDDPKIDIKVQTLLQETVDCLLVEAKEKRKELLEDAVGQGNPLAEYCIEDEEHVGEQEGGDEAQYTRTCPLKNKLQNTDKHLIRLRVEHSGFTTMNNQRFGARFVSKVANPDDILLFHRKKAESRGRATKSTRGKQVKDVEPMEPEELDDLVIEDLVVEQLDKSDQKLKLFDEKQIGDALDDYVTNGTAQAINEKCDRLLAKQQKKLIDGGHKSAAEVSEEQEELDKENEPNKKKSKRKKSADDTIEIDDDDMEVDPPKRSSGRSRSTKRPVKYTEDDDDLEDDEEDDVEIVEASSRSQGRSAKSSKRRTTKSSKTKKSKDYSSEESDDDDVEIIDSPPPPAKVSRAKKSRSSTSSVSTKGGGLSQSTLSFEPVTRKAKAAPKSSKSGRKRSKSYDDDSDEYTPAGRSFEDSEDWGTAGSTF